MLAQPSGKSIFLTSPQFWPHGDADTYGQVCYHNASLRAFLIAQVKLVLAHNPDAPWLSITQNDNMWVTHAVAHIGRKRSRSPIAAHAVEPCHCS